MLSVTLFSKPPPEAFAQQIVGLSIEYLTDLSLSGTPPSNPLHPIHQVAFAIEIGSYLQAMGQYELHPVGLLVATDSASPGQVLGFLKFLPVHGVSEACGITYMAVRQGHRGKGIARAMMSYLLQIHPHIELSCFVEKVTLYEKLGFQVIGTRDTQVRMCTRDESADGLMAVLDTSLYTESPHAQQVTQTQLQKHGAKGLRDAEKALARHIDQRVQQAEKFTAIKLRALQ